ncbi:MULTISPECIES: hypothetical protein [Streptomyces]|uniref:Uncharacterized protein n=1 Tax=Streptomyces parvus TaxID=66428 RepID=A0A5D4I6U1_9ACTN|nr:MULTISPECIES: hypothetical protein [Streptomyces]PVC80810.1 hypothetical protein DBP12_36985 [Streptomyces sp. CS014]TYR48797.1 hypothetical protein FY004_34090 [Streptomyces parvus]
MGRVKKNKPHGKQTGGRGDGSKRTPATVSWTPLKHVCGCVADWGWSSQTANPFVFKEWFITRLAKQCPWHEPTLGGAEPASLPDHHFVSPLAFPGVYFQVRKATGDNVPLGAELASRLTSLLEKASQGDAELLAGAPHAFRGWLMTHADNPAQEWLDHELTEIILNQGRSALPRELLEHAAALDMAKPPSTQPTSAACNVCSFAASVGGLLCECGHDWSCHPGMPGEGEPCSHCPCPNMIHI